MPAYSVGVANNVHATFNLNPAIMLAFSIKSAFPKKQKHAIFQPHAFPINQK